MHGSRRQRKPRQPAGIGGPDVGTGEEATHRRRQCVPPAVQNSHRRAACVRAGGCGFQDLGRPGGRRGGSGVFRAQKVRRPRRMKSFRDIRVIPVVLIAVFGLALLKIAGLVIDGGYVFDYTPQPDKPQSWAQETFNFPGGNKTDPNDITGSVQEKPKEEAPKAAAAPEVTKPDGVVVYPDQSQ